jgi:anti-anti-sigma factor
VFTPAPPTSGARRRRAAGKPDRMEHPATLDVTDANGRRCVALSGDLDLAGTAAIRAALMAELADHRPITLDLTQLGFVASVGAGLLLEVAERARTHQDLDVLLPGTGPAHRLLELTGLASALQPEAGLPR